MRFARPRRARGARASWRSDRLSRGVGGGDANRYYYDSTTGESQWEHPLDVEFRALYEQRKQRQARDADPAWAAHTAAADVPPVAPASSSAAATAHPPTPPGAAPTRRPSAARCARAFGRARGRDWRGARDDGMPPLA